MTTVVRLRGAFATLNGGSLSSLCCDHCRGKLSFPVHRYWRMSGNTDYATVGMNFALKDSMVERASGQTVEDGEPSEVTELWTFMRARGGNWLLSAIQQT
jgi:hypothetical protein